MSDPAGGGGAAWAREGPWINKGAVGAAKAVYRVDQAASCCASASAPHPAAYWSVSRYLPRAVARARDYEGTAGTGARGREHWARGRYRRKRSHVHPRLPADQLSRLAERAEASSEKPPGDEGGQVAGGGGEGGGGMERRHGQPRFVATVHVAALRPRARARARATT